MSTTAPTPAGDAGITEELEKRCLAAVYESLRNRGHEELMLRPIIRAVLKETFAWQQSGSGRPEPDRAVVERHIDGLIAAARAYGRHGVVDTISYEAAEENERDMLLAAIFPSDSSRPEPVGAETVTQAMSEAAARAVKDRWGHEIGSLLFFVAIEAALAERDRERAALAGETK